MKFNLEPLAAISPGIKKLQEFHLIMLMKFLSGARMTPCGLFPSKESRAVLLFPQAGKIVSIMSVGPRPLALKRIRVS